MCPKFKGRQVQKIHNTCMYMQGLYPELRYMTVRWQLERLTGIELVVNNNRNLSISCNNQWWVGITRAWTIFKVVSLYCFWGCEWNMGS